MQAYSIRGKGKMQAHSHAVGPRHRPFLGTPAHDQRNDLLFVDGREYILTMMPKLPARISTGLDSLDDTIDALRSGDNVVWQVDSIDDYRFFASRFADRALQQGRRVVYFRFADTAPVVDSDSGIMTYHLNADSGFEYISTEVYSIVTREGEGVFYVFDPLSDLLLAWATDLMIGNFFTIVCPYLYQLNTVAYFALLRNRHSFKTVARIRETTQLLLDVYNAGSHIYLHPLKVKGRHSPTMFLPHLNKDGSFIPVTSSADTTHLLRIITGKSAESTTRNLDYWDRLFIHAQELVSRSPSRMERKKVLDHLCQIMIGREERILALARQYLTLEDVLAIKSRLIGTGYVGGKAAGMLIARNMLAFDRSFPWSQYLEPHDSFFIGSDVFYTYIVENGWWKLLMEQKTKEGYFRAARVLRENMLEGTFPDEIEEQFWRLIEYFGQSPIIIRSSSLLEDAFGNAFAGKYESIFSVNQGSPEERYRQFTHSVRRVFASTMQEDALAYRLQRGLDTHDEQMALLVQRVSGSYRKNLFFPDLAGVGMSYNTFTWRKDLDPKAGMLRLVMGLGTRAVNRVENDYPRVVSLDYPHLQPQSGYKEQRKYSQRHVDVLDIARNRLQTRPTDSILDAMGINLELIGSRDYGDEHEYDTSRLNAGEKYILTFDRLLSQTRFPEIMRRLLKTLEHNYHYPVDVEFTVNFADNDEFQINLVQCRPLQTKKQGKRIAIPSRISAASILFRSQGNFMGTTAIRQIKRIIYVKPRQYSSLSLSRKYGTARLIGKLNKQITDREACPTLLIGPGRWGTTTPALGVPVGFSEINHMSAIVEMATATGSLTPELSFGTHFFQDLVETDIFYVALFPGDKTCRFNEEILTDGENHLPSLLPDEKGYEDVLVVRDLEEGNFVLIADIISRKVICYNSLKTDQ